MKLIFKHKHEGIWFSQNGHRAYLSHEKPKFLFPVGTKLIPTRQHHIARLLPNADRLPPQLGYSRELIMFYRVPDEKNFRLTKLVY